MRGADLLPRTRGQVADKHARMRELRQRAREEFVRAYGGACECCGETEAMFLTLEHRNGGGAVERRARATVDTLRRLQAQGWDFDNYGILCFNCNSGRARNGGVCPHVRD